MDIDGNLFVILIIVASTIGWVANNWIRAKHGYALEDEWGGKTERTDKTENAALQVENRQLKDQLGLVHDRVAVLERIVTDKGYGLSDEIEALRDASSAGVPLDMAKFDTRKKEHN